ncbi:MAG: hypothetical protein GF311_28100 [Candidatus Lokiarchaeota archaeon]|nr:hypothetical protein [Candidatus Lokiarchaeota archaeon]
MRKALKKRIQEYIILSKEDSKSMLKKKLFCRVKRTSFPVSIVDYEIKDYLGENQNIDKLKKYVDNFGNKFKKIHLYLWSNLNGTQKTTVASWIAKELILKDFDCQFVLMDTLLKLLVSFNDNQDEINKYLRCDFLVLDDSFDSKKVTVYRSGYQIPFLDNFLRQRLEGYQKATCFTSNFSIDSIDESVFGKSICDLVDRNISLPMEFNDKVAKKYKFNIEELWG